MKHNFEPALYKNLLKMKSSIPSGFTNPFFFFLSKSKKAFVKLLSMDDLSIIQS